MNADLKASHALTDLPADLRQARRDLRGLVVLELIQRTLALGLLVLIAGGAVVTSRDRATAILLAFALLLALAYLALAFRIRVGQEPARRYVHALELREQLAVDGETSREATWPGAISHPYRPCAHEPAVPTGFSATHHRRDLTLLVQLGLAALAITGGAIAMREVLTGH